MRRAVGDLGDGVHGFGAFEQAQGAGGGEGVLCGWFRRAPIPCSS